MMKLKLSEKQPLDKGAHGDYMYDMNNKETPMSDDFPTIVHVVQSAGEILGDWIGEAYSEPQLTGIECRYIRADRIEALEAKLAKALEDLRRNNDE